MIAASGSSPRRFYARPAAGLVVLLVVYLALIVPTVFRQGINWDEQTDLTIAEAYTSPRMGLVSGVRDDAINTRLPMYAVGLLFRLTGSHSVYLARLASCLVGALAIVGVYLFCARELDPGKGLVACAILATSPYFLAYSGTAFTEGDVYLACAVVWVLVAAGRLLASPSMAATAGTGIACGLAVSAKVSGVSLLPAVLIPLWLGGTATTPERLALRRDRVMPVLAGLFVAWLAFSAVLASRAVSGERPPFGTPIWDEATYPRARLFAALVLWAGLLAWLLLRRRSVPSRTNATLAVLVLGGLTFFVVPPDHTTNPFVLGSLVNGLFDAGSTVDPGYVAEIALFHFLVVWIKPSIVIGAGLWIALAVAAWRARRRPELRLPVLVVAFYGCCLLFLPWAQTRYMMAVFPVLAVLAADAWVGWLRRRRALALGVALLAAGLLSADLLRSWPDLSLNGYQWVGARYLAGRSTLGYRGIAQFGSDGAEQALRWVADRARPEETVVTYLVARHIVQAVCPHPRFRLRDGLSEPVRLDEADYVVTSLNDEIRHGDGPDNPRGEIYEYPYDRQLLEREFERAFTVRRAFGLEVASVWRRKGP